MDPRAEKLAKARKKLRDHQEKKTQKDNIDILEKKDTPDDVQDKNISNILNNTQDNECSAPQASNIFHENNTIKATTVNDVNMTEYLMLNQKCLEDEIQNLQKKLTDFNVLYNEEVISHNNCKQKLAGLEFEISNLSEKYSGILQEVKEKDAILTDLNKKHDDLKDENNNLMEQLDFTKTMLKSKETENSNLHNQVCLYFNQLEAARLQVQQLSNDTAMNIQNNSNITEMEQLQKNISCLEQKLVAMQQERDNMTSHYEHYMKDLTMQLNKTTLNNEELSKEVNRLYDRESSLIGQISDLEIRLQNFNKKDFEMETQVDTSELQRQLHHLQTSLELSERKNVELQNLHDDAIAKMSELKMSQTPACEHDTISVTKLTADITSDKLAAQRATEQNLKLKSDLEDLQQVVVKMTKDKLELTEMLTHEKSLSKELMLKLADIEEQGKNVNNKLKAKDDEMMRLQNESREILKMYNEILEKQDKISFNSEMLETGKQNSPENKQINSETNNNFESNLIEDKINDNICLENLANVSCVMEKEDAMLKLQERFMNIMDEVANLSDEKHRLEHIILQLQNETDTICEYVALYQQQRSLLKKRDEERTHQLQVFETECNELKDLLRDLRDLLFRLAEDNEISTYLKSDARHGDMARIWELLKKLQSSSLINKNFKTMDLNSFYPCSCCSGKLIDV